MKHYNQFPFNTNTGGGGRRRPKLLFYIVGISKCSAILVEVTGKLKNKEI